MNYAADWEAEHSKRLMYDQPLKAVKEFFADFDVPEDIKVLEVGCGAGSNAVWLANQGFHVYAFDSSTSAILRLIAQDTDKLVKACVCDATVRFPFSDEMFDVVLDVRALENLSKGEALLAYKEIARVMVHGGMFFGITASSARDLTKTTCGRVRRATKGQIDELLMAAGLQIAEVIQTFDTVHDLNVIAWKD